MNEKTRTKISYAAAKITDYYYKSKYIVLSTVNDIHAPETLAFLSSASPC